MNIKSKIESLLFISAKPMTVNQLASLLKKKPAEIKVAGDELVEAYKDSKGGVQIIKNGLKYQMVSSPDNASTVQEFIKDETTGELSRPSLEALTIIAYRGPISKIDLDRIRGVNCSLIVRNLLLRGLIEARADKVKKETYYNVTFDFIRFLGINDIKELPEYEKLNMDDTIDRVLEGIDKENNSKANNDALSDKESADKDKEDNKDDRTAEQESKSKIDADGDEEEEKNS